MNYSKLKKMWRNAPRLLLTFLDNLKVEMNGSQPRRGPLGVVWDINNKCNAKCKYCDYWKNKSPQQGDELTKKEKLRIIAELGKANVAFLSFCNGEPLLSEELFDLIIEAKKNGLLVNVSTNGGLLEEKASKIIKSGLDFLSISIESQIPDVHDGIRGYNGLLSRIEKGIEAIKKIGKRNRPYIIARHIINKMTFHHLEDYLAYWETRVDEFILKPIMHNPKAFFKIPEEMRFMNEDEQGVRESLRSLLRKHHALNTQYHREIPTYLFNDKALNAQYRCFAGTFFCDIDYRGNLYPCIDGSDIVGNLNEKDFMSLWTSPRLISFRHNFKNARNCCCWSDRFSTNISIQKLLNLFI